MAHMNQEKKALIAAELKKSMPKGWKYSLRVRHHSTLVLTIASAPIDLIDEVTLLHQGRMPSGEKPTYLGINHNYLERAFKNPAMVEIFDKIVDAMNTNNWDRSDVLSDYFDVGHYINIQIGSWERPFTVTEAS